MFQIFRNNVPPEPHACLLRRKEKLLLYKEEYWTKCNVKNAVSNVFAMAQPWKKPFWKGQGGTEV